MAFALVVTLAVTVVSGMSAKPALAIAAALAMAGVGHSLARPRGSLAARLWQVNVAAAGLLLGVLGVLAGLIGAALATSCQDSCAAQPPAWHAFVVGAIALVLVVLIVVGAVVSWRGLQRHRAGNARWPRILTLAPSGLALVVAATTSAQQSLLAPLPTPQGHARVLATVACVEVSPARPCYSASNLTVAANAGELLVLWRDATSLRGVLLTTSGARDVFIADVPALGPNGSDAVAAAPLVGGSFAVVWSDERSNGVHGAIVSRAGQVVSSRQVTGDGVLAAWPSAALAATVGHMLMLFIADVPQPSTGTSRVRMLMLDADRQLRSQAPMRTLLITGAQPEGLQADELSGGAVALQTGVTTQVFGPNGRLRSTHPDSTVILGPAGGRVVPRLRYRVDTFYSSLPAAVTTDRGQVRLLMQKPDTVGFGEGSVSEDVVTGPGLPAGGWLAALNLNSAALVNSPDGLAVVGVRDTGNGKFGGGRDSQVVLIPIPGS